MQQEELLQRIKEARQTHFTRLVQTPLIAAQQNMFCPSGGLFFKAEQFQTTGSFKFRGATNKISKVPQGVEMVTASSGNHGIACAAAAKALGRAVRVFLPQTVSPTKREKIERLGAIVEIAGRESGETEKLAAQYALAATNRTYISPYNDPDIIAGQGTIGLELIDQHESIDQVFISLGGGGLVSGIGTAIKQLSPKTKIIGVSAANSAELDASLAAGEHVEVAHSDTLADGVAGGMDAQSITLDIARQVIDERIVCSEDEIAIALKRLAREENMLVEGAAALAYAGFLKSDQAPAGNNSVIVLCGGNFDTDKILRLVSEAETS